MVVRLIERSLRPLLDEGEHFVAARIGLDEIGLRFVELEQLIRRRRKA